MNPKGLLGYAGAANDNTIVALQVETRTASRTSTKLPQFPALICFFWTERPLHVDGPVRRQVQVPGYVFDELKDATTS
jgi:hypothetical protein